MSRLAYKDRTVELQELEKISSSAFVMVPRSPMQKDIFSLHAHEVVLKLFPRADLHSNETNALSRPVQNQPHCIVARFLELRKKRRTAVSVSLEMRFLLVFDPQVLYNPIACIHALST